MEKTMEISDKEARLRLLEIQLDNIRLSVLSMKSLIEDLKEELESEQD